MTAIYSDHLPVVELLLSSVDLDLSVVNKFGQTALHYACFMDNPRCVSLLGKDSRMTSQIINQRHKYSESALMEAVRHGALSCVREMDKLVNVDWDTRNVHNEFLEDVARITDLTTDRRPVLKFFRCQTRMPSVLQLPNVLTACCLANSAGKLIK